jgi:cytochrome P450 family 6
LFSGSTVEVKEMMVRFTTDVIASCAFGINSNSLKEPDSEFGRRIRTTIDFNVRKGLAVLMAFFAPYLNKIFRLNFMDDKTNNYLRQNVWNTVQYRWEKYFSRIFLLNNTEDSVHTEIVFSKNLDTNSLPFHIPFNYQR